MKTSSQSYLLLCEKLIDLYFIPINYLIQITNEEVKLGGWEAAVELKVFLFLVTFTFPVQKVQIWIANNRVAIIGINFAAGFSNVGAWVHLYPEQITLRMCCLSLGGSLLPFIQGESVQGIIPSYLTTAAPKSAAVG